MEAGMSFTKTYAQERKDCGMRVTSKDQELKWLWLTIHWFFMIVTLGKQNRFYDGFVTTLGKTVYFPAGWSIDNAQVCDCLTLSHEAVHIKQNLSCGMGNIILGTIIMSLLYLLAPFPIFVAWFRYKFERDAYRVSFYAAKEFGITPNIEYYVELLTGPKYLWTWYSKKQVRAWFRQNCT